MAARSLHCALSLHPRRAGHRSQLPLSARDGPAGGDTERAATQATSSGTPDYTYSIPSHLCPAARADCRRRAWLTGRARPTAHRHITRCVSYTRPAATQNRPALSISVLGPFRVSRAKRALKRAATRELIAYLALQPKGASRDELIEALWPAQDPERTRPASGSQ
jgi:hypothetical protein